MSLYGIDLNGIEQDAEEEIAVFPGTRRVARFVPALVERLRAAENERDEAVELLVKVLSRYRQLAHVNEFLVRIGRLGP